MDSQHFNPATAHQSIGAASIALTTGYEVDRLTVLRQRIETELIGNSPVMMRFKERLLRLAVACARCEGAKPSVLIQGETGAGKEVVARLCHNDSSPFIEINCATLPEHLLEAELFGYERGAFTGAQNRKIGLMEAAHGGCLFLDEIAEASANVQAKLLKAIEEQDIRRLGGLQSQKVSVRIIAATHADLDQRVREGLFRADLLYRLRVVQLQVPSLRDRTEDVPKLADHFLALNAGRYSRGTMRLSAAAVQMLTDWHWPGNVRELRNVMEQAVVLCDGDTVMPLDIETIIDPKRYKQSQQIATQHTSLGDAERDLIRQALTMVSGNVSQAARRLGVSRDTLRYRMARHGLPNLA